MGQVAVTGSVAFDHIMVFPGRFSDHILPEKTHIINVSFLVDRMERRRGGTAANIAYTMALLGERPLLAAAVGDDFGSYGEALEAAGVDTAALVRCGDIATASAFITTDLDDNQITAFYPGAMSRAGTVELGNATGEIEHLVVTPNAPDAMAAHIEQAATLGAKLVFAPAQQLPTLSDDALRAGLDSAWLAAGNDYEFELIRSRTGRTVDELRGAGVLAAVTRGGEGSELHSLDGVEKVPVAPVTEVVDPTGAGDAYVAGLLVGLRRGLSLRLAGRMGALASSYVVERDGTQTHRFTRAAFARRFRDAYGEELPALD